MIRDENDPENRSKWFTQHDALRDFDPPYVYHVVRRGLPGEQTLTISGKTTRKLFSRRYETRFSTRSTHSSVSRRIPGQISNASSLHSLSLVVVSLFDPADMGHQGRPHTTDVPSSKNAARKRRIPPAETDPRRLAIRSGDPGPAGRGGHREIRVLVAWMGRERELPGLRQVGAVLMKQSENGLML